MSQHQWSNLYIDFLADITRGCKWNCGGCGVPKEFSRLPTVAEAKEMSSVFSEFVDAGYTLDHFEVGPTDFAVSENFSDFLERDDLVELASRFNMLVLQSTLIEISPKLIDHLNRRLKNEVLNLYIIIDSLQIANEKYLKLVRSNLERLKSNLNAKVGKIDVTFNASPQDEKEFIQSVTRTAKEFGVLPWHTVSSARTNRLDVDKKKVLADLNWLNRVFDSVVGSDCDVRLNFEYGSQIKPTNRAYVWSNGRWFWPPVLYGHFINYDERFEISQPITQERLVSFEQQMVVDQYSAVEGKECEGCVHMGQCVSQGVVALMDRLEQTSCICPKEALTAYRGVV